MSSRRTSRTLALVATVSILVVSGCSSSGGDQPAAKTGGVTKVAAPADTRPAPAVKRPAGVAEPIFSLDGALKKTTPKEAPGSPTAPAAGIWKGPKATAYQDQEATKLLLLGDVFVLASAAEEMGKAGAQLVNAQIETGRLVLRGVDKAGAQVGAARLAPPGLGAAATVTLNSPTAPSRGGTVQLTRNGCQAEVFGGPTQWASKDVDVPGPTCPPITSLLATPAQEARLTAAAQAANTVARAINAESAAAHKTGSEVGIEMREGLLWLGGDTTKPRPVPMGAGVTFSNKTGRFTIEAGGCRIVANNDVGLWGWPRGKAPKGAGAVKAGPATCEAPLLSTTAWTAAYNTAAAPGTAARPRYAEAITLLARLTAGDIQTRATDAQKSPADTLAGATVDTSTSRVKYVAQLAPSHGMPEPPAAVIQTLDAAKRTLTLSAGGCNATLTGTSSAVTTGPTVCANP